MSLEEAEVLYLRVLAAIRAYHNVVGTEISYADEDGLWEAADVLVELWYEKFESENEYLASLLAAHHGAIGWS